MRISDYFKLDRGQAELDFVNVDLGRDSPFFVDPSTLRHMSDNWARECVALLQSFFDRVLADIKAGRHEHARGLLYELAEPNETRLGISAGPPQGRGVDVGIAYKMWEALSGSTAATTGLLEDLEDTGLLIPGIGDDIVSNIVTNVIRGPFIRYTQGVCEFYGIPMQAKVPSGV